MAVIIGQQAPAFSLKDNYNNTRTLNDFKGKKLVIYFYPKDNTPGCTLESCGFRDFYPKIQALNSQVIGVSGDSIQSHQEFIHVHQLPFVLLSDPDRKMATDYGAIRPTQKSMIRSTFILDEQCVVRKIWRSVNVVGHLPDVLTSLQDIASLEKIN